MSKKKAACKLCKMFTDESTCKNCGSDNLTTSWQGRIFVSDASNSMIANKIGIKVKGEYAIKVR